MKPNIKQFFICLEQLWDIISQTMTHQIFYRYVVNLWNDLSFTSTRGPIFTIAGLVSITNQRNSALKKICGKLILETFLKLDIRPATLALGVTPNSRYQQPIFGRIQLVRLGNKFDSNVGELLAIRQQIDPIRQIGPFCQNVIANYCH